MKSMIILAHLIILLFATCNKTIESTNVIPDGVYEGTFTRTSPHARYASAKVSIEFKNGSFSGTSDVANYPAICSGTFKTSAQTITVENECMFTANFDWSLIFKGTYEYKFTDGELTISKKSANDVADYYNLKKQ